MGKREVKFFIFIVIGLFVWATAFSMWLVHNQTNTYNDEDTKVSSDSGFAGSYFVQTNKWSDTSANYYIVYAKDTKVKYFVYTTGYKFGITPLYNADGTLQIYTEGE